MALSNDIQALSNELTQLRAQFNTLNTVVTRVSRAMIPLYRPLTRYLQMSVARMSGGGGGGGGTGGGGGGGGGTGGGGGGGGGNTGQASALASRAATAAMMKLGYDLWNSVKTVDNVQRRAMASNLTLEKMTVPRLDLRFSELAGEILTLREEGFRDVNENTLKLISTMKMTGQSTASLVKFLSKNSLELLLNTRQAQDLAQTLADTARTYGVTQEKMFEFSNNLTKALHGAELLGRGEGLTGAFAKVSAKLGGRADELLTQYASFITDATTDASQFALRSWSLNDKILKSNAEVGSKLLEQSIRTSAQTIQTYLRGIGTGRVGQRNLEAISSMFGGMGNVQNIMRLNKALDEQVTATTENNQNVATLKTAQERYADSMERVAKNLDIIVSKFPKEAVGAAGSIAGTGASLLGSIGLGFAAKKIIQKALTGAVTRIATGAVAGSVVPGAGNIVGTIVGIGGAALTLYDAWQAIQESTKKTADSTADINKKTLDQTKQESYDEPTTDLLDILGGLVKQFGPESNTLPKEALEVQKEQIKRLELIADKLDSISRSQRPTFQQR